MATTTTQTAGAVRSAVDQANARVMEAFRRRDTASIADLYMPDATVLPPNARIVKGREAIQQFWSDILEALGVTDVALETVRLEPSGDDRAYEIGRYRITLESGGEDRGKYVVVWKREDGAWRLDIDIWNSDLSPEGA